MSSRSAAGRAGRAVLPGSGADSGLASEQQHCTSLAEAGGVEAYPQGLRPDRTLPSVARPVEDLKFEPELN